MRSSTLQLPMPADDDVGILLFGDAAARREMLPAIRSEAKRRALGIVPCTEPDAVVGIVASRKELLLCVIAWPDDQTGKLTEFIEELRRRQANPLLEIIVSTGTPFSETVAARLRTLRVTPHRRRETADAGDFPNILATAVRHAVEKRSLGGWRLSPLRTRGLIELAGVFGQALQRRNAVDLLRLLPLRGGEAGIAGAGRRRPAKRRRKPAPCGLR